MYFYTKNLNEPESKHQRVQWKHKQSLKAKKYWSHLSARKKIMIVLFFYYYDELLLDFKEHQN